jgi:enamine deaminase RidA (YjgF/YER057c/UK114 family)
MLMVVLQHVVAPDGVAAGRGYSQVVTGRGRLVVVSGQIAQDERGELVGAGDPAAQARQARNWRDSDSAHICRRPNQGLPHGSRTGHGGDRAASDG